MKNRRLSGGEPPIIVAILIALAQILPDPLRAILTVVLIFTLIYLLCRMYIPNRLFSFLLALFVTGSLFFAYRYFQGLPPPPKLPPLEEAYRDALKCYNLSNFDCVIEKLEPFKGTKDFEPKLVDRSHHLLGLAYLSLQQPRCQDTFRLLSSIVQPNLERSLHDRCKAMSCKLCQGRPL